MPADFLQQLLFERHARCAGFGESCRDKDDGLNLLGGAVVDNRQDDIGRNGDDGEIDGARHGGQRREGFEPGHFACMWIDREDCAGKPAAQEREQDAMADSVHFPRRADDGRL